MSERAAEDSRAVLVGLDLGQRGYAESVDELAQLALSAGVKPMAIVRGKRHRPDSSLFAGSGKVDEIREIILTYQAGLVIFNHDLSPAQERNLEKALECRVIDRTNLILDIFAQRAQSAEGKLQVELAQLEHLASRLVRGWTHLERQKGGIGLRGPGETQLETDRRLIGKRVKLLKDKLAHCRQTRRNQRRARAKGQVLSVSLVGYTNAGKSTVFNGLTNAQSYVANKLFATLDTTTRRVFLPDSPGVVVSDTVGFIRELPHELVAAFRATLEETIHADVLLHVVDASSGIREAQMAEVDSVLAAIGADKIPIVLVWNKIDLGEVAPGIDRDEHGKIQRVRLSARTGAGMEHLRSGLAELAAEKNPLDTQQRLAHFSGA